MLYLVPTFFRVGYENAFLFITGGCTECHQVLSKPTAGMPGRTTFAITSSSSCTDAWCYQVLMLTRATALCAGIPSCFNILGDCKWFLSPLTQSCLHDTPLLSKAQQYSVSAFTGQGHGLTRSGTDL